MKQKITKNVLVMMAVILLLGTIFPSQIVRAMDNEKQFEKIDEFVEKQKENFKIPALAIGIVSGNEVVYQKGFGKADSEGRVVTPQTPFEIGSVSKSFTALAVMQLVDADKIDLDKTIDQYLPWFQATYKGVEQKITVQQLLNHSSGIKEFYVSSVPDDSTIDQLVRENLNHMHLNYLPGYKSEYSNANYIILGGIIQEVTGLTFPEYLTKYIYEPLEMKHSYVSKEEAIKHNLADGNKKWFGFPVRTPARDVAFFEYSLADGYMISCLEDMTHYVSALMNQGRYKNVSIASPESIALLFNTEMEEEYVPAGIEGTKSYYGFGWRIVYNNDKLSMYQHTGETAEYHANLVIKPEEHIGIIQLANFGGEMTPISIGVGVADIMTGKEPKISNFINTVYIAERVIVFLIVILLLSSIIRLKNWKKRIEKSKGRYYFNLIFGIVINFILPIYLIIFYPQIYDTVWASIMLIFPDGSWTILLSSVILLLIGVVKVILTIPVLKSKLAIVSNHV